MTDITEPAGTRGAVDLSGVAAMTTPSPATAGAGRPAGPVPGQPAPGRPAVPEGLVVEVTATGFEKALAKTLQVPGVLVLWSSAHDSTRVYFDDVVRVAASLGGRVQVLSADLQTSPELGQVFSQLLVQAFGKPGVPATIGFLQGQPAPLFVGAASEAEVRQALDQLLQLAVQNGITGRVELTPPEGEDADEELSPTLQEAYDAIERDDLPAAVAAYERALVEDPDDVEARLGLGQVRLMQRTRGVDLASARAAAAADPGDVDAAIVVADLDVVGGHVEDAFTRLLDLVRTTSGDEREKARAHLLSLFDVVGNHDERVRKGRTALMSALF